MLRLYVDNGFVEFKIYISLKQKMYDDLEFKVL